MKELRIIGGGLAGLSLGIGLRKRGVPVQLIEKGTYPQHKVCGEFISGVQDAHLQELGILRLLDDAQLLERMEWWIDGVCVTSEELPTAARGIARSVLDLRLADYFVEMGGDLKIQTTWRGSSEEGIIRATGKSKKGGKKWIGLKAHYEGVAVDSLEMHSGSSGYAGIAAISEKKVNVSALFEMQKGLGGERVLENYMVANGMGYLVERLDQARRDDESVSAIAGFSFGEQDSEGEFAVGDAQYSIPPFTGNGMSMALESSAMALPYLEAFSSGTMTWENACAEYRKTKHDYFKKRCCLAAGLHPLFFNKLSQAAMSGLGKRSLFPTSFLFNQLRTP
jgi:2-polyprenyl-6-methoxyphenol hydroxylase-like FAD-dependent oxidoreductase